MTTTMTKKQIRTQRLEKHYALCSELGKLMGSKLSGKKISTELFKLERMAHSGATAYCNGEVYNCWAHKQWRTFNFKSTENAWEDFCALVRAELFCILPSIPEGFFVNGDARGYALKIDPEFALPLPMHTDWGRNQILSPDLNND